MQAEYLLNLFSIRIVKKLACIETYFFRKDDFIEKTLLYY